MNIFDWGELERVFYKSKASHFNRYVKKNSIEELYTELLFRGALTTGTRDCYLLFDDDMFIIIPKCAVVFDGDTVVDIDKPYWVGIYATNETIQKNKKKKRRLCI